MLVLLKNALIKKICNRILKLFSNGVMKLNEKLEDYFLVKVPKEERLGESIMKKQLCNICGTAMLILLLLSILLIFCTVLGVSYVEIMPLAAETFSQEIVNDIMQVVELTVIRYPITMFLGIFGPIVLGYLKKRWELKVGITKNLIGDLVIFTAIAFVALYAFFLCIVMYYVIDGSETIVAIATIAAFFNLLCAVIVMLLYKGVTKGTA